MSQAARLVPGAGRRQPGGERQQGAEVNPAPPDYEQRIRNGSLDAVLIVSDHYGEEFVSARPAKLKLIADYSRRSSLDTATRINEVIRRYSGQVGGLRLLARGVSPEVAQAILLREADLSTQQSRPASLLSMVPIYLLVAICIAGLYAAVDSTAGERERGSLKPLLLNPVPPFPHSWSKPTRVASPTGHSWHSTLNCGRD